MRTPRHSGLRRRSAVPFTLMLAVAVAFVASGSASGQSEDAAARFQASSLTPDSTFAGSKSSSGYMARTDPSLLGRTDATRINVFVKYDFDATASYTGGVAGLRATSPSVTGKGLRNRTAAVRAYDRYTAALSRDITADIRAAVPSITVRATFRTVYGGIAASLPANEVGDVLKVDGVSAVQRDTIRQPLTDATPKFIGATEVWPSIGGSKTAGQGRHRRDPRHGHLAGASDAPRPGAPASAGTYGCQFGDGSDPLLGAPFACNDKLIGAYAFTDTYLSVYGAEHGRVLRRPAGKCSARDADGHGTHTATTAAGVPGPARGPHGRRSRSGQRDRPRRPRHRLSRLPDQGCFQSDSVAAIQQAILDGVDVINFSIGGGSSAFTDPVELAFLDAYANGISVNASAGNDGPGASTVEHDGPWVTTVAASTYDHMYLTTLRLKASNGATLDVTGSDIVPGLTHATSVVLATALGQPSTCDDPFPAGSAAGKVVVCERGVIGRNQKSFNVLQGGAVGMILYNPTLQSLFTDNFWVPTVMIEGTQPAAKMLAFIKSHHGVTARWSTGTLKRGPRRRDGPVLVARSRRRLPQARRHRSGHPDPGRSRARFDRRGHGPDGPALPGDRRHLDVEPAFDRRVGPDQGRPPELDPGPDQVGPHDLVGPGRAQGERRDAVRSVRPRSRLDPGRSGDPPDGHLRRAVRATTSRRAAIRAVEST